MTSTQNQATIGTGAASSNPPGLQSQTGMAVSPEPPPINPIAPNIDVVADALTQLYNRVNSIENWMSNGLEQRPRPFVVVLHELGIRIGAIEQTTSLGQY